MNKQLKNLSIIFLSIFSIALISWGAKGHRAVAAIAEKHLTLNTANAVFVYLKGETMPDASNWADEIRNQPEYKTTGPWHFVNLPLGLNHEQFVEAVGKQDNDNIYTAILKTEANLKDKTLNQEQKNEALKFLIHLVGDAHQPMHVSRKEDKGGNTIQVRYEDRGTNLHSLWDTRLIDREGLSNAEMAKEYDRATPAQIKQWQSDSPMQWLWESYQISTELYAEADKSKNIDEVYYKKYIPVIHQRIEQAGIRLAGELNKLFKDAPVKISNVTLASPPVVDKSSDKPVEIKLEDVKNQIGKYIKVTGKVYSSKDIGSMVLVNLGAAYPNQLLTVALKGNAKSLANQLDGKTVTVEGTIITYKDKPEVVISSADKLSIQP
ncbi:MAG: hypothetical protein JWR38_5320 [Mucilaginibacter sp.]|nr:hypothetical protein [Mucilaginibacter sp.]